MKTFLLLMVMVLFIGVFCGDYRSPSHAAKKCMEKIMGKLNVKKLIKSLRKYHKTNAKATILDFILEKRPELKNVAEECLLKTKRRRRLDRYSNTLNAFNEQLDELFNNEIIEYYMRALLRDKKAKNAILSELDKNEEEGINACKQFLGKEEMCKMIINTMRRKIIERK